MFGVDAGCVEIDIGIATFALSPREIKTIKRVLYVSLQAQWPLCSDATARVCAPLRIPREDARSQASARQSALQATAQDGRRSPRSVRFVVDRSRCAVVLAPVMAGRWNSRARRSLLGRGSSSG